MVQRSLSSARLHAAIFAALALVGCQNKNAGHFTPPEVSVETERQPLNLAPFGDASLAQRRDDQRSNHELEPDVGESASLPAAPTIGSSVPMLGGTPTDFGRIVDEQLAAIPQIRSTFDDPAEVDNAAFDRALDDFNKGRLDEAIPGANTAIASNPEDVRGYELLALCYVAKGEFSRAIPNFDAAIRRQPKSGGLYIERGSTYLRMHREGRALADLNRAVELVPDNVVAFVWRSVAQLNNRRQQEAIADATTALRMNPRIPDAYFIRCLANLQLGRTDDARRDYEAALPLGLDEHSRAMVRGIFEK
ncbi:MAG TPA: tetratricopeptide repeat protein [Pirellulales bacterium]|jgi:tetratricopeptide (TPR) repeat protein|nr:tetratricopeptide repeat protein [Pirellulales bacterium]